MIIQPDCKGLVFRFESSSFLSKHNSIEDRKSLRLLKRDSCIGCSHCEWLWECLKEDISCKEDDYLENLVQGQKYKLCYVGDGEDFELLFNIIYQ